MSTRRAFITLLGSAAVAWPLAGRAQQPAMRLVGFLHPGSADANELEVSGFLQGLKETGLVEGHNVAIEYRWTDGQFDRFPALAIELVRRPVDVIFAVSPPAVLAIKAQTATIPVVFSIGEDPVKEGLVPSFNRPGGNVTGFSNFGNQLFAKKLGLLHDTVTKAAVFGLLVNPTNPNAEPDTHDAQAAAGALGLELRVFTASTEGELEPAFAAMAQLRVGGLLVNVDGLFISRRGRIAALAAKYAIPAIYERRQFPVAGGFMSYGASEAEGYRQCGVYVGRILNGAKPADLPVQQLTKLNLVINLKTAKALGLEIPPGVLAIADEVIE
jgi:putative tryptophan/tyrosine transport system substrate-binding protein